MVTIVFPLLVCVLGAVLALIPNRGSQLGLGAFVVGLWWVLYLAVNVKIHVG